MMCSLTHRFAQPNRNRFPNDVVSQSTLKLMSIICVTNREWNFCIRNNWVGELSRSLANKSGCDANEATPTPKNEIPANVGHRESETTQSLIERIQIFEN